MGKISFTDYRVTLRQSQLERVCEMRAGQIEMSRRRDKSQLERVCEMEVTGTFVPVTSLGSPIRGREMNRTLSANWHQIPWVHPYGRREVLLGSFEPNLALL